MLRRLLTIALACTAALGIAACESAEKDESTTMPESASMGMINDRCPISNEASVETSTVSYMGYKIGLCCGGCTGGWNKMSDDDKREFVAKYNK